MTAAAIDSAATQVCASIDALTLAVKQRDLDS
jgi:hypothetical protein